MLSMLKGLGQYVWGKFDQTGVAEVVENEEEKIEKELALFEAEKSEEINPLIPKEESPSRIGCFEMTGTITKLTRTFGLIDNSHHFFVTEDYYEKYREKDVVHYLAYSMDSSKILKVVRLLSMQERSWDKNVTTTEEILRVPVDPVYDEFEIGNHDIIGKVSKRSGTMVILEDSGIQLNLDAVKCSFRPIVGDWLQLNSNVQLNDGSSMDKIVGEILEVNSISSLRSKQVEGYVTCWDKAKGIGAVDNTIMVIKEFCRCRIEPEVGDKVFVDAIESHQGVLQWRALSLKIVRKKVVSIDYVEDKKVDPKQTLHKFGLTVSGETDFGDLQIGETKTLTISISNNGRTLQTLKTAKFLHETSRSQMTVLDLPGAVGDIAPGESRRIAIRFSATFYGLSEEKFAYLFKSFEMCQTFRANIVNPDWEFQRNEGRHPSHMAEARSSLNKHRDRAGKKWIPGVKTIKPPPFVCQRLPTFSVPQQFWDTIYDCYENSNSHLHLQALLEKSYPCLNEVLSLKNYTERFHALLYLEEIHTILRMKRYDIDRAHMISSGQFLVLNIEGLSERRPSLMVGDSVKVEMADYGLLYEGCVHQVNASSAFLLFSPDFHSKYRGEDVSVEFSSSRAPYIKCHQGAALAVAHLGSDILFPEGVTLKLPQIDAISARDISPQSCTKRLIEASRVNGETIGNKSNGINLTWYNDGLNTAQKFAVVNALRGVTRPVPFVIFGPPGTGKTITLVETILQLLKHAPYSRLLVATPSNSAADHLSELLISFGVVNPGTMVRLVAQHVALRGNTSDILKPYCATVDISMESAASKRREYNSSGMRVNCPKSVIGHHRIIVGTCGCIGSFLKLGFPRGHFTHVIADEAGQATEPELMVALSFIDQNTGQIILAGDPMQLGPVVMSQFANQYGLEESYLERLLQTSPYQRDSVSFGIANGGYDPRHVVRLNENYRSIPRVLRLAADMFYEGNLEARLSPDRGWAADDIVTLSEFLVEKGWSVESGFPGIVFHGVRGVDYKSEENPSWFNPCEAAMVLMCTLKLYRLGFQPQDIGIISPYLQQTVHIRSLFQELTDECPKTGSVEDFQGQERKVIILTTVRCSVSLLNLDVRNVMGFVKHPKRLNVSITRAKLLLIIIGDPHLLAMDPLWCRVINYALHSGSYIGCNLPQVLTDFECEL